MAIVYNATRAARVPCDAILYEHPSIPQLLNLEAQKQIIQPGVCTEYTKTDTTVPPASFVQRLSTIRWLPVHSVSKALTECIPSLLATHAWQTLDFTHYRFFDGRVHMAPPSVVVYIHGERFYVITTADVFMPTFTTTQSSFVH